MHFVFDLQIVLSTAGDSESTFHFQCYVFCLARELKSMFSYYLHMDYYPYMDMLVI